MAADPNVMPRDRFAALNIWSGDQNGLEDELFLRDFYRYDPDYSPSEPLVITMTGGLIAFIKVKGIDPEPFGLDVFADGATAVARAMNTFSLDSMEEEFKNCQWEISNYFVRQPGSVPKLVKPAVENAALEFLYEKNLDYWTHKELFTDQVLFTIHLFPKLGIRKMLQMRDPFYYAELEKPVVDRMARYVRRVARSFLNDLVVFKTSKPEMNFQPAFMNEDEIYTFLFQHVNKRFDTPLGLNQEKLLSTQVSYSVRQNDPERGLMIGDQRAEVITFKHEPAESFGNSFKTLLDNCRFPFTICQIFNTFDDKKLIKKTRTNKSIATSMKKSMVAQAFVQEAEEFTGTIELKNMVSFMWKFSAVIAGAPGREFDDRVQKFKAQLKHISGAEPMNEDYQTRYIAEMATMPGNGFVNMRQNVVTTENVGDLVNVWLLQEGSREAHLVFVDRAGGIFKYNLFEPGLPSWNAAVLGGPGSGKSLMMNMFVAALANVPHQIYVVDIGNSFGPVFSFMEEACPGQVAIMRFEEDRQFRFNPFPLIEALEQKEQQIKAGTYRQLLSNGQNQVSPCPVELAKELFTAWLQILFSPGQALSPNELNALDVALNGESGKGGFFLSYEEECKAWLQYGDGLMDRPRPLSSLRKDIREAAPMFMPVLTYWTRGDKAEYFDSGQDSLSTAKAVYLELSGLDRNEELKRPFIAALMAKLWQRVTDPTLIFEKKLLIYDEAWAFLNDPAFSDEVEKMLRTIRKFEGLCVLSTQTPDDIKKGDNIKLLRTMNIQFLYKGFNDAEYYREIELTPDQIELHKSVRSDDKIREVFIWNRNGYCRVVRVDVPPHMYWFVTSDALDKGWRGAFVSHFGSLVKGVEHLVNACGGVTVPSRLLRSKFIGEYSVKYSISLK
jgi:type IV secretory pathway VirB4 component